MDSPEERRQKALLRHQKRYARLIAAGLCTRCAKNSPAPGRQQCLECLAKTLANAKLRRARYLAEGKCGICGTPLKPGSGFKSCFVCRLRDAGNHRKGSC